MENEKNLPAILEFSFKGKDTRTVIGADGEPWWVARDICEVLGIVNYRDAVSRLDDDEKDGVGLPDSIGRVQTATIINESGLYTLIIRSDKPDAKAFRRWITHDVIPAIRKTGGYNLRNDPRANQPIHDFIRRIQLNQDRVTPTYFSVISQLYSTLYARMERVGYILPDKSLLGKELRPDVSVGRYYADHLRETLNPLRDRYTMYPHLFPDGSTYECRQYPNDLMGNFTNFVEQVWVPRYAQRYFQKRDIKALELLPKLLLAGRRS